MQNLFLCYLYEKLRTEMEENNKEYPTVSYKCKILSCINLNGGYKILLKVLTSSHKGKLSLYLKEEEKIKLITKKINMKGTIIKLEENEVTIHSDKKLEICECVLTRIANFNNNELLKHLEKIIFNEKEIRKDIVDGWIDLLVLQIKNLFKSRDFYKDEGLIKNSLEFYIKILKEKDQKVLIDENTTKQILEHVNIEEMKMSYNSSLNLKENIDFNTKTIKNKNVLFCLRSIDKIIRSINDRKMLENNFPLLSSDNKHIKYFDESLNFSQRNAVAQIFNNLSFKIIGPPGTGKTSTIVEIIAQLLNLDKKILVCGPSNISVDNIIDKFMESKFYSYNETNFYRLGSSNKGKTKYNLENIVERKTKFMKEENSDRNFKRELFKKKNEYRKDIRESCRLVFSTLFSSLKEDGNFDWVIIDEACQSTSIESYLSLVKGKKFILVGDPHQLSQRIESLYEIISIGTCMLDIQYRMSEKLIEFSNRMFYNNQISSFKKGKGELLGGNQIIFIDTQVSDYDECESGTSKCNVGEVEIAYKVVNYLDEKNIGIITPYSSQVALLQERIKEVEVATVDGFQGREKDIIILSLVRSNRSLEYGFLDDYKRLNVAITRCRKGLIIIGNSENFRKSELFSSFFKYLNKNHLILDPSELDYFFLQ